MQLSLFHFTNIQPDYTKITEDCIYLNNDKTKYVTSMSKKNPDNKSHDPD